MPIQKVKCKTCGTIRDIRRKYTTPKEYSFWCEKCHKEVAQDLDFIINKE
jgi:Zn finger protein HypA/HybF involved in hydrogenase expression